MDKLTNKVYETIRSGRLFEPGTRLVVGVSGGADSVALLLILHELAPMMKLDLAVAHFNHRWRGAESDADEKFVAGLARRLPRPFRAGRAAQKPGKNREARARDDRYQFLSGAAARFKAAAVAVAHHADDQAETFLINLLRGAGPDGLSGMDLAGPMPGSPGLRLVRPLLGVTRAELRDYLGRIGQDWREDSSNQAPDFLRNRVRVELLPLMASINPAIAETLGRTADVMREQSEAARLVAANWLGKYAAAVNRKIGLPLENLRPWPTGLRLAILREAIRHLAPGLPAISRAHLADLDRLACGPGCGSLDLPGMTAQKQYDFLGVRRLDGALKRPGLTGRIPESRASSRAEEKRGQARALQIETPLRVPGRAQWAGPGGGLQTISVRRGAAPAEKDFFSAAAIDPRKISGGLRVCGRRRGDRYQPAGCDGRRSLKDVFNQLRVPPSDRDRWPLIADDEEILWVPGMRPAEKVAARGPGPVVVIAVDPGLRAAPLPRP